MKLPIGGVASTSNVARRSNRGEADGATGAAANPSPKPPKRITPSRAKVGFTPPRIAWRMALARQAFSRNNSVRDLRRGSQPLTSSFRLAVSIPNGIPSFPSGQDEIEPTVAVEIDGLQVVRLLLVGRV